MKKLFALILACVMILSLAIPAMAQGNGLDVNGQHYNLNIIGVSKDKIAEMDNAHGHVIFVPLVGKTRILLSQGDSFRVLDANGTNQPIVDNNPSDGVDSSADGTARFQLPTDLYAPNGECKYYVFARALGSPKGEPSAQMTPGYYVQDANGVYWYYMSTVSVDLQRTSGKQIFENITSSLMYVYYDYDGDGDVDKIPLFSDYVNALDETYFWDYDNQGLKHAQLRFYPVE